MYPVPAFVGNGQTATTEIKPLSPNARALGEWLQHFHADTGDVWATTAYFAKKVKRSSRTVYRWLAELRQHGHLTAETGNKQHGRGKERHLTPTGTLPATERAAAPKLPQKPNKKPARQVHTNDNKRQAKTAPMSRGLSRGLSRGPHYSGDVVNVRDNNTGSAKEAGAKVSTFSECGTVSAEPMNHFDGLVLETLCSVGVDRDVARNLLQQHGAERCREQVNALPLRKARDKAALLVKAIAKGWKIPAPRDEQAEKQQQSAQNARRRAARAVLEQQQAQRDTERAQRLAGLSTAQREALEQQAVALWQQEQPGGARVMLGKVGGTAIVQGYMLRLLDERGEVPDTVPKG